MILFLDFDGVLHPETLSDKNYFSNVDLFEKTIANQPELKIVISSTWRLKHDLAEMQNYFSKETASRIIDITPEFSKIIKCPDDLVAYSRHAEINEWLRINSKPWEKWIAIDDRPYLFKPFIKNLVICDRLIGFDLKAQKTLLNKISSATIVVNE
jgi:hypothetical protein